MRLRRVKSAGALRRALGLGLLGLGSIAIAAAPATPSLPVLTTIAEVRALSPEEAARHYPVHLQAVVTQFLPPEYQFFIQDSTGGIYFNPAPDQNRHLEPGDQVDVTAFTDP